MMIVLTKKKRTSKLDDEKLKWAYYAHKLGFSVREIADKVGIPKTNLGGQLKDAEDTHIFDYAPEVSNAQGTTQDAELQKALLTRDEYQKRAERFKAIVEANEEAERLKEEALMYEAQTDKSKIGDYIDVIWDKLPSDLMNSVAHHQLRRNISFKQVVDEAFEELYMEWAKHEEEPTFLKYVIYSFDEWVSLQEIILEEEKKREEEERKRDQEEKMRRDREKIKKIEASLKDRIEPKLECPLCKQIGILKRVKMVNPEFGVLPDIWYQCMHCTVYFRLHLKYRPDSDYYDGELSPMPFARLPTPFASIVTN